MSILEFEDEDSLTSAYSILKDRMEEEDMKLRESMPCIEVKVPQEQMADIENDPFEKRLERLQRLNQIGMFLHAKKGANYQSFNTRMDTSIDFPVDKFLQIYEELDNEMGVLHAGATVYGSGNFPQQAAEDVDIGYTFQIGEPNPWFTISYDGTLRTDHASLDEDNFEVVADILGRYGASYDGVVVEKNSMFAYAPEHVIDVGEMR
ncbi:MAG: hypothetical protein H8Z69_04575 [Nanohaloarchaea archaeon]|nr:hypothetical protein [Candidatus Nanohaloarchaea archaeon]